MNFKLKTGGSISYKSWNPRYLPLPKLHTVGWLPHSDPSKRLEVVSKRVKQISDLGKVGAKFHTDNSLNDKTIGFLPKTRAATCRYFSRQETERVLFGKCEPNRKDLKKPTHQWLPITDRSNPVRSLQRSQCISSIHMHKVSTSFQHPVLTHEENRSLIGHRRKQYEYRSWYKETKVTWTK